MTCLDMETLIRYYHPSERGQLPNDSAWYLQHPQQLLPPPRWARDLLLGVLDWCKYDDEPRLQRLWLQPHPLEPWAVGAAGQRPCAGG